MPFAADAPALPARAQAFLDFWFGPPDHPERLHHKQIWFRGTPEFDAAVRENFTADHDAAAASKLRGWEAEPLSALAHVMLLDQVPRNVFRSTPRAFASDDLALATTMRALERGFDQAVPAAWRLFFYLPFEHSEVLAHQQRGLDLMLALPPVPGRRQDGHMTRLHLEIIERFGRFPHRNAILGRELDRRGTGVSERMRAPLRPADTNFLALIGRTAMAIIDIGVTDIANFADGHEFGAAGAYVRIKGVARGMLDPNAACNAGIVDLDMAPLNAKGLVDYATDFDILRPKDPSRGSGILVYDVPNRGSKRIFNLLDDIPANDPARTNDPKTKEDAGLGFCLGRGYSLAWSGWDPGAPRANNGLGAEFPPALENDKPIVRRIRDEFHFGTRTPADGSIRRLSYPAAALDQPAARLTVRDRESDRRTEIPRDEWEFLDDRTIRMLPVGRNFTPIKIYELWYEATGSKVLGIGYASVRDLVSFFRCMRASHCGVPNPLLSGESEIRHALAFGVSQSGRFLRHFLELGMNTDEAGQKVFDGVFSHVAGAGKVFANHSFSMPGRTATQHEDRLYPENWFPFSTAKTADPVSGQIAALLPGSPNDPKIIETNSATEYWQKGASLIHTDSGLRRDLKLPENSRAYLIAGTQHGGRPGVNPAPGPCVNPRNWHSATPALRALFVALEDWVTKDLTPPPSLVPSIAAGTAVTADQVAMPQVSGFAVAPGANPVLPPVDWIDPPETSPPAPYTTFVSAVDSDGNETAGIRLPSIAVPLGTHTGWNVYKAQPDELADRDGSFIAFARTKAEREAAADPRPSLAERYGSRNAYIARVRAAAEALVAERLLLQDDADALVTAAEACDKF